MKIIPIAFAVDDNYAPFLAVTITSILCNSNKKNYYKFYVLNTGLNDSNKIRLLKFNTGFSSLEFVNVEERLSKFSDKLFLRDYYTKTTYYRFFIPSVFPEYDKMLYLDSDLICKEDISKMFNKNIGTNLVGAVSEEVMQTVKVFKDYVEKGLGIPCEKYFNAGVLLLNLKELRKINIEKIFYNLLNEYKFEVTQDQDYLNVICKNRVYYFDLGWNKTSFKNGSFKDENLKIIHYKIYYKPWLYDNIKYADYFWEYAKKTDYYSDILKIKQNYNTKNLVKDLISYKNLMTLAKNYIYNENKYVNGTVLYD